MGGPGLAFETWVSLANRYWPEHPGLKSETWATHSKSGVRSLSWKYLPADSACARFFILVCPDATSGDHPQREADHPCRGLDNGCPISLCVSHAAGWAAIDRTIAGLSLCPECNRSSRYRGSQCNADSKRVPQRSWSRILCRCSLLTRREGAVRGHRRHRRSGRDVHRRLEKDSSDQPQRRIAKPSLQGELCGSARAFKRMAAVCTW